MTHVPRYTHVTKQRMAMRSNFPWSDFKKLGTPELSSSSSTSTALSPKNFEKRAHPTPPGNGPYCYRIHGAVYHRSGLLHPDPSEDTPRKFCQIYILEGDGALQARLNNNTETDPNLMFELQNIIETCSPYTNVYKRLHDIEQEELNQAGLQNRQPHAVGMVLKLGLIADGTMHRLLMM